MISPVWALTRLPGLPVRPMSRGIPQGGEGFLEPVALHALAQDAGPLPERRGEEGRRILAEANHPRIVPAATMLEAAEHAAELAREGVA